MQNLHLTSNSKPNNFLNFCPLLWEIVYDMSLKWVKSLSKGNRKHGFNSVEALLWFEALC